MYQILYVAISLQFIIASKCETLPESITKCHYGDNRCVRLTINEVIEKFPKGIPVIGMKAMDVVKLPNVQFANNDELNDFWFKLKLYNQSIYGFENTVISEAKGFVKDPTSAEIKIRGVIPKLVCAGNYDAKGRMLWMLNINATGVSKSELSHVLFRMALKVQTEYRNNKRYLKINELTPNIGIDRWQMWFDNFFPKNPALTTVINTIFNENWSEIWKELENPILLIFTNVFLSMLRSIFDNVPYDDLFISKNDTKQL
ncbi:circadian clock-controlled protein daywake-like [Drosophila sulfurigaster albostrigata]|uniref:circadian clock-controlled protein daywake-like n=1 Tax=Drosophila sulfurigaster albostrigata TaxID=89887 RepID=UPI002D21BB3E|nr:circadian clock-controlled protein daywake-like [Drosophila sulfurigaster albostrigata]